MTERDNAAFDSFEEDYDPLADDFDSSIFDGIEEDDEAVTEFLMPDPSRIEAVEGTPSRQSDGYRQRPAEERTAELFTQMKPYRLMLLQLIRACQQPRTTEEMLQQFRQLHANFKSTYSGANLLSMLEAAGAIDCIAEDGTPYAQVEVEPVVKTDENGVEYLAPGEAPTMLWVAAEAGLAMVEANNPQQRIQQLFAKEAVYLPIFKRILRLAAADEGVSMAQLSGAIDEDPLIQEPRYFSQHFLKNLERHEAVAWQGNRWHTTPLGRQLLEEMADVDDSYSPSEAAEQARIRAIAAESTMGAVW